MNSQEENAPQYEIALRRHFDVLSCPQQAQHVVLQKVWGLTERNRRGSRDFATPIAKASERKFPNLSRNVWHFHIAKHGKGMAEKCMKFH